MGREQDKDWISSEGAAKENTPLPSLRCILLLFMHSDLMTKLVSELASNIFWRNAHLILV